MKGLLTAFDPMNNKESMPMTASAMAKATCRLITAASKSDNFAVQGATPHLGEPTLPSPMASTFTTTYGAS